VQLTEIREAERVMRICNACRYCEGYCAVFPAIERRESFSLENLNYLANLCHNCGECLDACQYAPPHEFGVDVPKLLEGIRNESYRQYAWPRPVPNWILIALGLVVPALFAGRGGNFYSVIPYRVMVGLFVSTGLLVTALCAMGLIRFWRDCGESFRFAGQPVRDALTLRYLDKGPRRWFHHFTFYGFALCFASTCTAAFYQDVLGLSAPYGYFSLPVALGTGGGIALVVGTLGLIAMKYHSSFLVLLFLTAASGLALLTGRETAAMSFLLVGHLGIVLALFLTMPYGKFVHAIYRSAALLKYALESRGIHR
jgi:citrate/tricarballylate utilization protein